MVPYLLRAKDRWAPEVDGTATYPGDGHQALVQR